MKDSPRRRTEESARPLWAIRDWHAVIILTACTAIFFRDILLQRAFFWEDFLYQFYPFRNFAAVSLADGELPLWNPYTFSGMPFQADIQSALFYVPNLLLTLFVHNGQLHFIWVELMIVLHYALAGVGMYFLAREFDLHRMYALFSGLVFMLSGFLITHAIHQVIVCQVAWMPLIVLLFRRALVQRSLVYAFGSGFVLGQSILAGFPQVSLYVFFFLFVFFVFEFVHATRLKGLRLTLSMATLAALVIVVALGFAALQLLPTLELAPLSQRAEISYQKSLEGALDWKQIITLIVPKFFGSSGAQGSDYWGPGAYWQYWETCLYVGIPALIALLFAVRLVRRNRYVGFFAGVSVFAILYAVGDGFILHPLFFHYVPGFETFRSIGRMTLLFTFCGSLMAGFGLMAFASQVQSHAQSARRFLVLVAIAAILVWILVRAGFLQPDDVGGRAQAIHALTGTGATTALMLALVTTAVLFLQARKTLSVGVSVAAIMIVQFADVHAFGFAQNNSNTNPKSYFDRSATLVRAIKQDPDYVRINSRQGGAMIMDRNQGMIDRIFLMEGYTPLALQRLYPPARDWNGVCDLLNAKYRISVDEARQTMGLEVASTYLPRAFLVNRDTVIVDESAIKEYMESAGFNPRRVVILEKSSGLQTRELIDDQRGSARIVEYSLNKIALEVTTPQNVYLVLSEVFYPGWNAYVDGNERPVYRANWNMRAIPLDGGTHHVEVRFEPSSFRNGLWITIATIGVSAGGMVYSHSRKRKSPLTATQSGKS
jgi:hypothetical protein